MEVSNYISGILIKFGEKQFMEKLLNDGEVYTRPLADFKKKDNHKRYDDLEGLVDLRHLGENSNIYIKRVGVDEPWKSFPVVSGKSASWHRTTNHIYSLFRLTGERLIENPLFEIPEQMRQFGDHLVIINNPTIFLERLGKASGEMGFGWEGSDVDYYDPSKDQKDLTLWHKPNSHAFAQEFRFIFDNTSISPCTLSVGSLTDIASLYHIDDYKDFNFIRQSDVALLGNQANS